LWRTPTLRESVAEGTHTGPDPKAGKPVST
jgi:hypothetical protein